jgi:AraC-like DNA-binding protein
MASIARAPLPEFLAGSEAASVVLDAMLYFRTASGLTGYVVWEDPSDEELATLARLIEASLDRAPHPTLVDGRQLSSPPVRLFEYMQRFIPAKRAQLEATVHRLAIVRAPDLSAAAALGYCQLMGLPYPFRSFDDLAPALAWLGQEAPADLAALLNAHIAEARGVPPLLYRLRQHIQAALPRPDIAQIATRLALSERTLMRRLAEHGTTFGDEVARTRVAYAQRLLEQTDAPVETIARRVGCASLSSFSILFRKWQGTSPTAYRKSHRQA